MSLDAYADFIYRAGWLHLDDPAAAWRTTRTTLRDPGRRSSRRRATLRVRRRGHRPDGRRRRAHLDRLARRAQLPRRRGLHRAARDRDVGRRALLVPGGDGRPRGAGRAPALRGRPRGRGGGRASASAYLEPDAGDGRRRDRCWASSRSAPTTWSTQFTKQILFDEKIGGTCHMALGAGYPDTGSLNRSGLHWDMVCDLRSGGEIHADGEPIYRDGRVPALVLRAADPRPPRPA